MFQLIFNEKLSTSEVGSLILKNMQSVATSCHELYTRSEILPKEKLSVILIATAKQIIRIKIKKLRTLRRSDLLVPVRVRR